jgi:iron complex transport system substrate-binding protein
MNRLLFCLILFSAAARAEVSGVDSSGRRIALAAPAQRIVSLAPHVTELLFAAGAGAKVVAVSEYSDYPEEAKRLPRVASSSAIDLERVLALRADLAVAWRLSSTAQSLDRLQAIGVPVFYSEPHRLAEIPQQLEALGVLAGTESAARPAAAGLRLELEKLRSDYRGRPLLTVFYQISERPLMTVNGRQFISDALSVCGARNLFADAPLIAPTVNAEAVLAANPDVIIAARGDSMDTGWHDHWNRFGSVPAVRDGNLITVRASEMHRHGPRAFAATRQLCEQLEQARRRASRLKAASPR